MPSILVYPESKMNITVAVAFYLIIYASQFIYSDASLLQVQMTLVQNASALGAYCLDGSLPGYHLHRGFGDGVDNWLVHLEGGGWCNTTRLCSWRVGSKFGSTLYMDNPTVFYGILSNKASQNPDFYNWNRVKIRYCDGASFAGDGRGTKYAHNNGTRLLYFRGQRIWEATILELLSKGMGRAKKALLTGCSAGGLAALLHCDNFASYFPRETVVKCMSDAGFFMDVRDISLNYQLRTVYEGIFSLQGVQKNLESSCSRSFKNSTKCFFPQYALQYITTPVFILNSAYDVYQFNNVLVPPSADLSGHWNRCKSDPRNCDPDQIEVLQGFRNDMIAALMPTIENSSTGGMFINSCFTHCQSESQDAWYTTHSPTINNKTIADAVGDWYFDRSITKEIDCAYPCDTTCLNSIA